MTAKILVVDDDLYIRVVLEKKLTALGYSVVSAANGEAALELAQREIPDVIISDWTMPKMDGIEFCLRVRKHDELRYTYFILLTAKDAQDDRVEAIEQGADDFLTKPFNDRDLVTRIKAGLRIGSLQKELAELQHQRAIVELALTLGHEINNPLGVISLNLQVVQRKADDVPLGRVRKELEYCIQGVSRLADIVRRLATLREPYTTPYLKGSDTKMVDLR